MKTCTNHDCIEVNPQPLENFCKNKDANDGLNYNCRKCTAISFAKFKKNNGDKERLRYKQDNRGPQKRFQCGKRNAKTRGYEWALSLNEWKALALGKDCHYCGGILCETGVGLDRKNNAMGYTLDNVVPCCKQCNSIKNECLTYKEAVLVIKILGEFRKLKIEKASG